jgi:hypothetical protein
VRRATGAAALAAFVCAGVAAAQPDSPQPPKLHAAFGWFPELAGSCWKGDHPDGRTSDKQCYRVQYGGLLRGTIEISREGRSVFEGEGVFAVEAGSRHVAFAQWGGGGTYATGEMTLEGDRLVFRNRDPDGSLLKVRSAWRRTGPDSFRVTRERDVPEKGWTPILEVEYRRVP